MKTLSDLAEEIKSLTAARYPFIYLSSTEEGRVIQVIEALGKAAHREVLIWNQVNGFEKKDAPPPASGPLTVEQVIADLKKIAALQKPSFIVLKDFHPLLVEPAVVRELRNLLENLRLHPKNVFFVGPLPQIPRELEKEIFVVEVPLPAAAEIEGFIEQSLAKPRFPMSLDAEQKKDLVRSLQGLSFSEIERVVARFKVKPPQKSEEFGKLLDMVHGEKRQILRQTGALEFYPEVKQIEEVGGLDQLKVWLKQRTLAFSEKARAFGLPAPRGLLLLGVQGCGKSLMAKATAGFWRLPLLRLDVSSLKGQSGRKVFMSDILRITTSLAPVVLWLDEMDKAFGQMQGDAELYQQFGALVTWMQEKEAPVFVVATANSIEHLPPELLRKGRFDEIFFVDLPNIHERKEILGIHLGRRNRAVEQFPVEELAQKTEGFSGAEIEQLIIDGLYHAFSEERELSAQDLAEVLNEAVPLSTTMEEQIKALKEWARTRARRASLDTKRMDFFAKKS